MRRPRRATLLRVAAAAASGLLLAGSRPNFDVPVLALVGLVPLFLAWRDRGPLSSAGLAFVAGAVYHAIVVSWVWYFGGVAGIALVAALAGYWALAGAVIGWLRRGRVANPWTIAAVWVLCDAAVARFPFGGLSWGELGYAFAGSAPARALAGVGGLALVTFFVVALNALLADLVMAAYRGTGRKILWGEVGVALIAIGVVAATFTQAPPKFTGGLRVALVQGNDLNRDLTAEEIDERYLPNSHFELADQITDPVDLIVFPESSMDADPRTDPYLHSRLAGFAIDHHAWVLANATVDAPPDGKKAENLNVWFGPDGKIAGTYAKRHLVPFGEYVPFRSELEGMISELNRVPRDYQSGGTPGLQDLGGTRVANVICFESAFGYQIRPLVHDGAQAIIVSTNNRSYRRSANSAQHVAIGQMRAAETGRPVIQAAISGISAVIDADGVVRRRTHLFDRAVLDTTVAATTGQTPYVRYGEWVIAVSAVVVAAAVIVALTRRRRKGRSVDSTPDEVVSISSRLAGYGSVSVAEEHSGAETEHAKPEHV